MAKIRQHEQLHFDAERLRLPERDKITNKKVLFSCRRTFIDLHQTLHADRGRQYNFCHRQLLLDPISSFCATGQKTFLGF